MQMPYSKDELINITKKAIGRWLRQKPWIQHHQGEALKMGDYMVKEMWA
jgi:hypothetical protein